MQNAVLSEIGIPLSLSNWVHIFLFPLIVTLVLWGLLTIGLLWLNQRNAHIRRIALAVLVSMLVLSHHQLWVVRNDLSVYGCYSAFIAGMLIWAWHELAFYSGVLAGPWRTPCPPNTHGWRRFTYALSTHLYHEAAVVVELALLWWLHQDATNLIGLTTFGLMWALQHSAKLNVFLGIRSLNINLLPDHLRYLGSFWKQRSHNPFFLPSVLIASLLAVILWIWAGILFPAEQAIGVTLLATLTTLGVLEHWLLVLPPLGQTRVPVRPRLIDE